ncbi:DNA mismatch repair protein MutS [Domibacillus sp. PGB-M46]|uniref:DNA mismatch repair protein MutS n=1 Tax=Domibacillus sp. PGB-M46 TaxID=2910255 RepID=UPI001F5661BF|nr:DNA mismatch repair protein MutS [Domibacillus sp. PGB-M46]MCI2255510.1 DNA mismatch repair protein MutS [Domibacillus sp. PGB-M46]
MAQYTPMIQQYLRVKADYQDAFLFFRLGDFYEMFFEDALNASQILEITLTSRDGGSADRIPMCGVPYHSAKGYIERLVAAGHKVAICEQREDPKQAKGVIKREVVQVITPGTMMEGSGIQEKENHYLAVFERSGNDYAVAAADVTTGECKTALFPSFDAALHELAAYGVKEVITDGTLDEPEAKQMHGRLGAVLSVEEAVEEESFSPLLGQLTHGLLRQASARLYHYLHRTQKRSLDHLQPAEPYEIRHYMNIDYFSKRNLELTETIRSKGKKGSLLWLLDETKTAMGGRLLKQWIDRPLLDEKEIGRRLAVVDTFIKAFFEREELREQLKEVYDLERLAGRVAFGSVNARDLVQLKKSLGQIPLLVHVLKQMNGAELDKLADSLDPCEELLDELEQALVEEPPVSVKEGGMIRDGFHAQLDEYRDASRNGKQWIAELEQQERAKTGIKSLKIGYNRIFGYYIEVTKANLGLLEEGRYERKQTLANCERFVTPELKEKEALILEANEKMVELEYDLFCELREHVKGFIPRLQLLARIVSEVDVLQCFAAVSESRRFVRPVFSKEGRMWIKEGRHPVVEKVMDAQGFVPNDCHMEEGRNVLLITGPNMSGKSTYMRQTALIAILAQIGCYVPADEAVLPIFDQIFTRIGAADDLVSGQSTFMVEMLEAKHAIVSATNRSLILFDEIGRGTSTYDGMALAQAMIEYIHTTIGAKTLFSTHYHELTVLDQSLEHMQNVHVTAAEQDGKVVFLHKVKDGAADKSYGIHVAELAGLPEAVISRASTLLHSLENREEHDAPAAAHQEGQLSFFDQAPVPAPVEKEPKPSKEDPSIVAKLLSYDIMEMTPMEAMNTLYALQKEAKK